MKFEIETSFDTHECDLCGTSYAEGGIVKLDGEVVLEVEPLAHCYGGVSACQDELLVLALKEKGIVVLVDGDPWHICNREVSEKLNYES